MKLTIAEVSPEQFKELITEGIEPAARALVEIEGSCHGRTMNLAPVAAAEIAKEADRCIEELEARLKEAEGNVEQWRFQATVTARQRDEWVDWCKAAEAQLAEAQRLEAFERGQHNQWYEVATAAEARAEAAEEKAAEAAQALGKRYLAAEADAGRLREALREYADTANWYVDRESGPAHFGWLGSDPTAIAQLALSPAEQDESDDTAA